MTTILIVDDVAAMVEQYSYDLRRVGGYDVVTAGGGAEALELLNREAVDAIVLDLEMPGTDGFDVLRSLTKRGIRVPVIVYTGTGDYDRCIQAMRLGAAGFIDKAEPVERVVREIETTLERGRLQQEVATLRRQSGTESPLIGASPVMERLRAEIARLAPIPSTVLVVGESGSGKELVARELHRMGRAPKGPFFPVNCAALPEQLVESELFGHERGAFTGATGARKGAFEVASGGTLFLDEIGELSLPAQAKLLRVLEDNLVTRVGGSRSLKVQTRVVAATNRNLDAEGEGEGEGFRQDLLYRINAHVIRVPALREHPSDIPALVGHLLALTCERFGMRPKQLDPSALDRLAAHDWRRNNVRELRNIVERLVIATEGDTVMSAQVPEGIGDEPGRSAAHSSAPPSDGGALGSFQERKTAAERQIVLDALTRHDWHITKTAAALGLADHSSLLKLMRRLDVSRPAAE